MVNPRKLPKFRRWMSQTYGRLEVSWRKARGMQSKIRRKEKSKFKSPNVGYGAPRNLRFVHPSGFREVLIHNLKELEKIDSNKQAVKIAHTVGGKKRAEILKRAEDLKIKVLNP